MRSALVLIVALFVGPAFSQTLLIEHVALVDPVAARIVPNSDILIRDGRVIAIGHSTAAPEGAVTIDGTGQFAIPGLWDMHFHLTLPDVQFPMLIANGVTGIRDMYSGVPLASIRRWATREDAPRVVTPGFADGPLLLTSGPLRPNAVAIENRAQAALAVQLFQNRGLDFIKVYSGLPRDAFLGLMQSAKAMGMTVAGHVPEEVSPLEASQAGMRSQEHLNNLLLAASSNEEKLRVDRVALMYNPKLTAEARLRLLAWPLPEGLFDTYDNAKAAALFRAFVQNGTWQTPTLSLLSGFVQQPTLAFRNDARQNLLPKAWRDNWDYHKATFFADMAETEYMALRDRMQDLLNRYLVLVGQMHAAGVGLLAGTDANGFNPVYPGYGLHEELSLFVASGLTPAAALATATSNPARYFNKPEWGAIEAGSAADIVLLDGNPLEDIYNTEKIRSVILRGRYYSRQDLDAMLKKAADVAAAIPVN